jgi:histidinol-phosphate aminotransferase
MSPEALANPLALTQPVYEPGKPIEDVARELGLDPSGIVKLASNENALGPSPLALSAANSALAQSELYPDGGCVRLREAIARRHGLGADAIIPGNGSNEILELLGHAFLKPGDEVIMGAPAFIVYKLVSKLFGATAVEVPLVDYRHNLPAMLRAITPATKLIFLASPNNPTGRANSAQEIFDFANALPEHVIFAFDEAYAEYLYDAPDLAPLIRAGRKIVLLRTFSKIFGLAALRVGYGATTPAIASVLNRVRQPFNVNAIGQAAAIAALGDFEFVARCRAANEAGLRQLEKGLDDLGVPWVPSDANFLLARTGNGRSLFIELQKRGVIVRPMDGYGMPDMIRVTVGTTAQNTSFLEALADCLSTR